jgi:hypothetical protein
MFIAYMEIFYDGRERSILNPWRPFFNIIIAISGPPIFVYSKSLPKLRLWWRYILKLVNRTDMRKLDFPQPSPYVPRYNYSISNLKLQEVLTIEHVLLNIVDHSHYDDIINLSLACRAVREAVYPGRDLEHRLPKLRKHCCTKNSKICCLYCNKKICGVGFPFSIHHVLPGTLRFY